MGYHLYDSPTSSRIDWNSEYIQISYPPIVRRSHAEICPVCNGKGKLIEASDSTAVNERTCHGCGGKGWITVQDC